MRHSARACRPGPNLGGVGVEDRLIFSRHSLSAEQIDRSAVVEGLRQLQKPIEERASPLSAFSRNRSRAASCVDTRLALPCSLSLTGVSRVRLRTAFCLPRGLPDRPGWKQGRFLC